MRGSLAIRRAVRYREDMALTLDVLRHGEAQAHSSDGDASRALTRAGIHGIERLARRLRATSWNPDRAFASPYLRALQTARIVLEDTRAETSLLCLRELEPEQDPASVLLTLDALGVREGHAVIVAHLPLVDRLVTLLTGESPHYFSPGTLVRIACTEGLRAHSCRIGDVWRP